MKSLKKVSVDLLDNLKSKTKLNSYQTWNLVGSQGAWEGAATADAKKQVARNLVPESIWESLTELDQLR